MHTQKKIPLTVIVDNLGSDTAPVLVGVYNRSGKFLDPEHTVGNYKFLPQGYTATGYITDLEYGEYALAMFQDMDDDGVISRNILGIPKDPYAFSNNFMPAFKAPAFDDCCFKYDKENHTITISMLR
jgi:uncharacterized protein (DUF2141 family)